MADVQFILGRAGTGKSHALRDAIVALLRAEPLGPPVYLLVPRQATFEHERFLALAAGLPGFSRLRVVGFEELGEDVLAECGGSAASHVTPVGRQMLLGHLLRKHAPDLKFFTSAARQIGLVRELDRTFGELERAGKSSSELIETVDAALADSGSAGDPEYASLVDKTRDLALLGDAYLKALGDRLDATRRLEKVVEHLGRCRSLREAHLFVDGFYRMTAFERRFLAELAAVVKQTRIALTLDPTADAVRNIDHLGDEGDLFAPAEMLYRRLVLALREKGIRQRAPQILDRSRRFAAPALGWIEKDWSNPRPSMRTGLSDEQRSAVRLIEAGDPRTEADAAARQVRDWVNEGLRLRDVVVLTRRLSDVQSILTAAFEEHGLPYFIDRRRPAQHHPLIRFVRALLNVAMNGWPHESVMQLCKCGLAGMELDDADALENFILQHRIRGRRAWTQPEPWAFHAGSASDEDDESLPIDEDAGRVDTLRRGLAETVEPLSALLKDKPRPVREFIRGLWQAIEGFGVTERLGRWIDEARKAERIEEAEEHRQAWEELIELIDQAADLLGEETIEPDDFVTTLETGLDLLDLAIAPPTRDAVVLGEIERTRVIDVKATIVMGLSEGTFPRAGDDPTVLSDEERRLLREANVDVEADGRRLLLEERFLAYMAFTRPSHRLTLTRPGGDAEGRPLSPSRFWEHVRLLLNLPPELLPTDACQDPAAVATPRQLVTTLLQWARREESLKECSPAAAMYARLVDHKPCDDALGKARFVAWRALSYHNDGRLSDAVARELYSDGLYTSASRLETFAKCPYRHFATHVLRLRGRDDDEVSARDLGIIYHGVLEQLIRRCIAQSLPFATADEAITGEMLETLTQQIGGELRGRIMLSSKRNEYMLGRIRTTLAGVIAGQQAMLRKGAFEPLATELRFGEGDGAALPPLDWQTPRGRRVRIYGQIDRVDHAPRQQYAAVFDYKFSGRELDYNEVHYGLSLQLLLYLLVIQAHGAKLSDPAPQPVAALYVKLLRGLKPVKSPDEALDPTSETFDLRIPPRGVIDAHALPVIESDFAEKASGRSEVFKGGIAQNGKPYKTGDVVAPEQIDRLLDHARGKVLELADRLMEGEIDVRPYLMGTRTPCTTCDFRSVCRFDPSMDSYLLLDPVGRDAVLGTTEEDEGSEE